MHADAPDSDSGRGRGERWPMLAICALLVATGAFAWGFTLRPALAVDTRPLETLPLEIAGWRGEPIPLEDDVTQLLDASFNVQRTYRRSGRPIVWLYVGYYGTARGGHTPHTPWICYPAAGWDVLPSDGAAQARRELERNEIVVQRHGDRRLVHFWYRSFRASGITSAFGWQVDRMLGRLFDGRADGALVRISTPIDADAGGIEAARATLRAFGAEVESLLGRHWPDERVPEGPSAG